MSKSPPQLSNIVKIIVVDMPENSFELEILSDGSTDIDAVCSLKMDNETYQKLLEGKTTLEIEAGINNIEISGDTNLLRNFGKSLRNSN